MKRVFALMSLLVLLLPLVSFAEDDEPLPKKKNGAIVIELNWRNDEDQLEPVELLELGAIEALVRKENGEEALVATSRVTWDTNADEEQRVAYIFASNADKVTLRLTRAGKSRILKRVSTGHVAFVFDYHSDYTGVIIDGTSGYVNTSLLRFLDRHADTTPGLLTYGGSTDPKNKVKLRQSGSRAGKVLTSLPAGIKVYVYQTEGDYSEVEAGDWHGWIQTQYISPWTEPSEAVPEVPETVEELPLEGDL